MRIFERVVDYDQSHIELPIQECVFHEVAPVGRTTVL